MAAEQRRWVRGPTPARVSCFLGLLGEGPDVAAAALDLAEGGVRLLLTRRVGPGERLAVALRPDAGPPAVRLASVVWSAPAGPGSCYVGAAFDGLLTAEEMTRLRRVGAACGASDAPPSA